MPTPSRLSGPALIAIRAVRGRWRSAIIDTPAGELTARLPPPGVTVSVPRGGFTAVGESAEFHVALLLPGVGYGHAFHGSRGGLLVSEPRCPHAVAHAHDPQLPAEIRRQLVSVGRSPTSLLPLNLLR